jgi:hypothetical protein
MLSSANYNSYSPTLTGTGASGSWGISVTGSSASCTGNAATATTLQTARTIGGVSFNGSANIDLPGVNTAGNQNTTGNAGTVTNGVYTTGDQSIGGAKTFTRINFGATGSTPYSSAAGEGFGNGITFGGDENSGYYRIFTTMENVGGNYSKLALNWHTGIRIGAYPNYGGVRFYNNAFGNGTEIFSVGSLDSNVRVVNSIYAQAFYDINDTAYYLDPAGTSNLNTWTSATSTRIGRPIYWTNRLSKNASTGYHTGSNGWGVDEGTWANAWKGGFSGWDIWGLNTDHPQGSNYVHAQGIVSGVHFTNTDGSSAYGWMMVGAANATSNRYWLRGKWDTAISGWVEMLTSGNYNSFSPTLTGTGASGSWGISITGSSASCTGNAATVTNGVYTNAGNTLTGTNLFQSNLGTTSGSLSSPSLQAWATGTNAAFMSFHRSGSFAVNMGLDSDNVLRIGGWSAAANRWQLDMSGNQYLAASCRATIFYDIDNTGYYLDPNSTTSLRTVGSWRSDSSTWDGEFSGKIQYHSNHWYFQSGDLWIFRNSGGTNVATINQSGTISAAFSGSLTGNVTGNVTGTAINIAGNGAGADPYGTIAVTQPAGASNYSYYGLTRAANIGTGFGLTGTTGALGLGANAFWFGTATSTAAGVMGSAYIAFNGSSLVAVGTVDATQFRDRDNTAFLLDPASTSILNAVRTRNTYGERVALNSASPQTIDTQYNLTELTLTSSIATLTFSNIQASGIVHMWTLVTVGNATVYTITWPAAVKWPGGTAPTVTTTSGKRDIYQFVTYDGGTNIYAIIVGQNL